jgi:hypothetical protein
MSDFEPWVTYGDRVKLSIAAVGRFAFSPDDAHLAWTTHDEAREVTVTEVATGRTVAWFNGASVCALHWASGETLRVLRRKGADATLHAHAIPDGGELARVDLPAVGAMRVTLDASADGRTALVGNAARSDWLLSRHAQRRYLVRGELGEEVSPIDPFVLTDPDARARPRSARYALSPDGDAVAVVYGATLGTSRSSPRARLPAADAATAFLDLRTRTASARAIAEAADPRCVRWVSPSGVLVAYVDDADRTALYRVDAAGEAFLIARLEASLRGDEPMEVHPDRTRVLLRAERVSEGRRLRQRSLAMVLPLPAERGPPVQAEVVELGSATRSSSAPSSGGACWDRGGRLLTLTQVGSREAHVARRETAKAAPSAVVQFALIGAEPHDLALAVSPRGTRALATWRTLDRGEADPVTRMALIAL